MLWASGCGTLVSKGSIESVFLKLHFSAIWGLFFFFFEHFIPQRIYFSKSELRPEKLQFWTVSFLGDSDRQPEFGTTNVELDPF